MAAILSDGSSALTYFILRSPLPPAPRLVNSNEAGRRFFFPLSLLCALLHPARFCGMNRSACAERSLFSSRVPNPRFLKVGFYANGVKPEEFAAFSFVPNKALALERPWSLTRRRYVSAKLSIKKAT